MHQLLAVISLVDKKLRSQDIQLEEYKQPGCRVDSSDLQKIRSVTAALLEYHL